jgi:hypothetical protein
MTYAPENHQTVVYMEKHLIIFGHRHPICFFESSSNKTYTSGQKNSFTGDFKMSRSKVFNEFACATVVEIDSSDGI